MEILKKILRETVEKLREEDIYPEEILGTISNLKPSEPFLKFISKAFGLFCRKRNQDAMLAMFYGEIIKEWRVYFRPCNNQMAINVLLISNGIPKPGHLIFDSKSNGKQSSFEWSRYKRKHS